MWTGLLLGLPVYDKKTHLWSHTSLPEHDAQLSKVSPVYEQTIKRLVVKRHGLGSTVPITGVVGQQLARNTCHREKAARPGRARRRHAQAGDTSTIALSYLLSWHVLNTFGIITCLDMVFVLAHLSIFGVMTCFNTTVVYWFLWHAERSCTWL